MADILFPPDLIPATMQMGVDDFTALDESATTGAMQSSALAGTRRWHLRMDFPSLSRKTGSLARFEALTAALRGRANRVWINPAAAAKLRGSFPAVEMFVNNDFSNGIANWTPGPEATLIALDHAMRIKRNANSATGGGAYGGQSISGMSFPAPHVLRVMVSQVKGTVNAGATISATNFSGISQDFGAAPAMRRAFGFATGATTSAFLDNVGNLISLPGEYYDVAWTSFSRCMAVDNGVNLVLNSDTPGNGTGWVSNAATYAVASAAGPDGSATTPSLVETTANTSHVFDQSVAVASSAADFTASFFVKGSNRTWCYVEISNTVTGAFQWYNLSTGALGTSSIGANFTFLSAQCVDYGNGWKRCILTVRKTDASTALLPVIGAATADNVASYVGVASTALLLGRASFAQSSVPVAPVATAGTAQAGTLQTGYTLNLKGLPVSTQGLLLEGDPVECWMPSNSQLLRAIARLDSDGAGLGTLIFENALKQSPVDGAPVVVQQPMIRCALAASSPGIEYSPGVFGNASLEFVEATP